MIFVIAMGSGRGHVGIVSSLIGNRLETIEGNTNDGGSREGIGVFRRSGRTIDSVNRGFMGSTQSEVQIVSVSLHYQLPALQTQLNQLLRPR